MELNIKTIETTDFKHNGEWNNRVYFEKNGFEIVEHWGFYRCNSQHLSGYGKKIETVEELNALYEQWVKTKTQSILKRIEKLKQQLEILQNSVQDSNSVG